MVTVCEMPWRRYKTYLLALLMIILASNFFDRVALGVVLESIKADLELSDTQLGFLGGLAFAAFYALMGIPIARWADRGNRVTIIAVTTALWSAMVALCGTATGFLQLLLIRVGVAVGEAGCVPPAHSLLADYFQRSERPRAVGIYTMGAPLSLVFGYFAAGWLNQLYGWRATFVILGLPGLALAALARFTLKEPRGVVIEPPTTPRLTEVWRMLWGNMTFRRMLACLAISQFFMYGVLQWLPAFFVRSYGMQTGAIGTWFAASAGLCGVFGNYLGGALASRFAAGNEAAQLKGLSALWGLHGILSACIYLVSGHQAAFVCLGLAIMALAATNGPFFATIQTLVPSTMRAMSVAIISLFTNLIGLGLGPLAVGALSDATHRWFGAESLRYALLALSPGFLWCMRQIWRASYTVGTDIAAAQAVSLCDDVKRMSSSALESAASAHERRSMA